MLRIVLASPNLSDVSRCPVKVPRQSLAQPAIYSDQVNGSSVPFFKMLSYADDLEVFLSSPLEWNHLQSILQCYSRASNAKVNIQKTEVVSLSGLVNEEWRLISQEALIAYYTSDSRNAIRYLGYPLYSSPHQLSNFLDNIKLEITRMVHILQERHLSVRGLSLIANSLLLSQLWHILRVVPVPKSGFWKFSV